MEDNKRYSNETTWLIAANPSMYDHSSSFDHYGYVDWRQGKTKYKINDIVFIYCTLPVQKIMFKCRISNVNMSHDEIRDDREYWKNLEEYYKSLSGNFMRLDLISLIDTPNLHLTKLLENGLNGAPQGPQKMSEGLVGYVNANFNEQGVHDLYPDILKEGEHVYEGLRTAVLVNKYERSSVARNRCIEHHGVTCQICKMSFFERYGDIGKGFIHVHHIVPIHTIKAEYKIDYKNDLIPVCPNCHAMLHRKKDDGSEITIEELKDIIAKSTI